jgi:hypothetical protein
MYSRLVTVPLFSYFSLFYKYSLIINYTLRPEMAIVRLTQTVHKTLHIYAYNSCYVYLFQFVG